MRRPLAVTLLSMLVIILTLACSPSRLFGGEGLKDYVGQVRVPAQEFVGWAQEVIVFANAGLREANAEALCRDGTLAGLVGRGRVITGQLQAITPPSALEAPHSAVTRAASSAVTSLATANDLACEKKDLAGGLEALEGALGPLEELLGKLQELQKLLPKS